MTSWATERKSAAARGPNQRKAGFLLLLKLFFCLVAADTRWDWLDDGAGRPANHVGAKNKGIGWGAPIPSRLSSDVGPNYQFH
jgi:hypothetical protein